MKYTSPVPGQFLDLGDKKNDKKECVLYGNWALGESQLGNRNVLITLQESDLWDIFDKCRGAVALPGITEGCYFPEIPAITNFIYSVLEWTKIILC